MHKDISNQVADAVASLQEAIANWQQLTESKRQLEKIEGEIKKRTKIGLSSREDYIAIRDEVVNVEHGLVGAEQQFAQGLADLRFVTGTIGIDDLSVKSAADIFRTLPTMK